MTDSREQPVNGAGLFSVKAEFWGEKQVRLVSGRDGGPAHMRRPPKTLGSRAHFCTLA
jgi:hypothetical protein|tara:strand:- start:88 stop:261 length:174 start_codon:yes stop_codon:yes gene_type:complete